MSTAVFKGLNSSPGNRKITSSHNEPGDLSVERDLTVGRNLIVEGDFEIVGTTDRLLSDTYNHEDPELVLNSEYTGGAMPDIGIRGYRGDTYVDAVLKFYSTLPGGYWGAGTVGDIQRIARIDSGLTTPNAIYYDVPTDKFVHHPDIYLETTQLRSTIPIQIDTGVNYSTFSNTVPGGSTVMGIIGMTGTVTGETTKTSLLGYKDVTYDGTTFKISPTFAGGGSIFYETTAPISSRTQHIFNNYLSIGRDDSLAEADYPALINSDVHPMRLEASTELCLKVDDGGMVDGEYTDGPRGQIIVQDAAAIFTVPADFQGNWISVQEIVTNKITTQAIRYQIPSSSTPDFSPIPTPTGWDGSITYDAETYVQSWQELDGRTKYEVQIDVTFPTSGGNKTMVFPIDIGGSLENVRNIYGVIQDRTGGGGTVRVLPIPNIDIEIIPSFELDPVYLTAAELTAPINYFFIKYRYKKSAGIWRWIFTVETIHPAVSI